MGRPTKKAAAPKQPGRVITNPKQVAAIYEVGLSTVKRNMDKIPHETRPRGLEGSRNNHFFDTNEIRAHLESMGAKPGDSRLARLDRIHRGEE